MRVLVCLLLLVTVAHATWKPEYSQSPPSVQEWFRAAPLTNEAKKHFPFPVCCEQAERLMTKFVGHRGGEWSYYPDPNCTTAGCKLLPIPDYVVHEDPIRALNPKDDGLIEFEEMRRQGVLFIYQGVPTCFWPPEPSI